MGKTMVIIGSILLALGALGIIISLSGATDFTPEDHIIYTHIYSGTPSTFAYDGGALLISAYAIGDHTCSQISASVTDAQYEYLEQDCDPVFDTSGYTYLGNVMIQNAGAYEVDSDGYDLVLVDQSEIAFGGLGMLGGCCFLLIGLLLLIVGLVGGKKQEEPQVFVVQDPAILQQLEGVTQVQYQQQPIHQTRVIQHQPQPVEQAQYIQQTGIDQESEAKVERYVQMLVDQGYPEDQAREHASKHVEKF